MMSTATGHYLGDFPDDSYRALRSPEYADTWLFPRSKSVVQYLNPGDTKWAMKREPMCRFKSNSILFNSYPDTAIVASEFLETHSSSDISIIGHFSTKEFLPFIPSRHIKSKPREYWPQDESPEEEHEKNFHMLSIPHIFHHCKRQTGDKIDQTIVPSNAIPEAWILAIFSILRLSQILSQLWKKFSSSASVFSHYQALSTRSSTSTTPNTSLTSMSLWDSAQSIITPSRTEFFARRLSASPCVSQPVISELLRP